MFKNTILLPGLAAITVLAGFSLFSSNTININSATPNSNQPENSPPPIIRADGDIGPQTKLTNPPDTIRALYVTAFAAATPSVFDPILEIVNKTSINALVINIKDDYGYVTFNSDLDLVKKYKTEQAYIKNLNRLIKDLHDRNIYIIGRLPVFQDRQLAKARPDLAIKDSAGNLWRTRQNLNWVDPASREVWDYNVAIAQEILSRGIDEVNFDYIRFPDGAGLTTAIYPVWDGTTDRRTIIDSFFTYLDDQLSNENNISADIFGQVIVTNVEQGIGQRLTDAHDHFDFIAPMIYPSHFAAGTFGYQNPAAKPYEIILNSLLSGINRVEDYHFTLATADLDATSTAAFTLSSDDKKSLRGKFRPWLQDFDLGAVYTVAMVKAEIQAVEDAGLTSGWMIWNPRNVYRSAIFE